MGWLEREWRAIVTLMSQRVGPKHRPFGEVVAYGVILVLAMIWLMVRWDFVSRLW